MSSREGASISIHAPRVGRDVHTMAIIMQETLFQSTRPVWGATLVRDSVIILVDISIHAPRVGRDPYKIHYECTILYFNPRAPCGARLVPPMTAHIDAKFQSTRPVWGATKAEYYHPDMALIFQSTRPVWGATRCSWRIRSCASNFNPRAPCGARPRRDGRDPRGDRFQSTRPVWGATPHAQCSQGGRIISIHAPRVGRDRDLLAVSSVRRHFNPRAPCGARRIEDISKHHALLFQSTRPVWGATCAVCHVPLRQRISIHAPRVGRDREPACNHLVHHISIHAPRVGRDVIH